MWILDDKDALLEGAILASFISEMITSSAYKDSSADNLVSIMSTSNCLDKGLANVLN